MRRFADKSLIRPYNRGWMITTSTETMDRMPSRLIRALTAGALILAGGAQAEIVPTLPSYNAYDSMAQRYFRNADWARARELVLEINGSTYVRSKIDLVRGQPHQMVLKNTGAERLVFAAPAFFKTSAVRELHTGTGGVVAPFFHSLVVEPNAELRILLVPTELGQYEAHYWPEVDREKEMTMEFKVKTGSRKLF